MVIRKIKPMTVKTEYQIVLLTSYHVLAIAIYFSPIILPIILELQL